MQVRTGKFYAESQQLRISIALVRKGLYPVSLAHLARRRGQDQAAGRNSRSCGHQDGTISWYLVDRVPAHLPDGFGDPVHAVDVRLTELAAMRIKWQPPADLDRPAGDEVPRLTARAETQLFELHQNIRREVVIQDRCPDVVRSSSGLPPQLPRDHAHLRQPGHLVAVVAGHGELAWPAALGRG